MDCHVAFGGASTRWLWRNGWPSLTCNNGADGTSWRLLPRIGLGLNGVSDYSSSLRTFHGPVLLWYRAIPVTTWVPMNAANAHQSWPSVTAPFADVTAQPRIIPTQTMLAAHIASIVKIQSNPPMIIPLTGYAKPLNTCVTKTTGNMACDAARTWRFVVNPRKIDVCWRYVVNDNTVATPPPKMIDVLIKWRITLDLTEGEYVFVSAISRLSFWKKLWNGNKPMHC